MSEAEPSSSCSSQWQEQHLEIQGTTLDRHDCYFGDFTSLHNSYPKPTNTSMSSTPLQSLWDASASQPFTPTISKEQQFTVGFALLFAALVLTGLFGMSMWHASSLTCISHYANTILDNSLKNLPLFAVPASLTFG